MTPEEREKLPHDEQTVWLAAFAASYVMHTHDAWDKRNNALWNANEDAGLAVAAFKGAWK